MRVSQFLKHLETELLDTIKYRYVIYAFVETNLKLRYRRSYLGFIWTVLAPILNFLVIGIIFNFIMQNRIENFFQYYFSGAVFFSLVSNVLNKSPFLMIQNEHFIKKIYVPKLVYILNTSIYEFTNFVLSFLALLILGLLFGVVHIQPTIILSFVPILLLLLFLVGIGTVLCVLTVYFRDFMHITPVGVQALFFLTPVIYTPDMIPQKYQFLVTLNPFYYFLDAFRDLLVRGTIPSLEYFFILVMSTLASLAIGLYVIVKYSNRIVFKL